MSLVDDILKGLPVNPILREQVSQLNAQKAAVETENAILKDDLRKLKAENEALKKQITENAQKPSELHTIEIQILQVLSIANYNHDVEGLSGYLGQKPVRVEYHLGRLEQDGYILGPPPAIIAGMRAFYSLTHKGREYLVKHDLLP